MTIFKLHITIFNFLFSVLLCCSARADEPTLKILDIGNSYALDATMMLPKLITASGVDQDRICVYVCFRKEGSFKNWYDIYNDVDSLDYYVVYRRGGKLPCTAPTGTGTGGDGSLFRRLLTEEKWDIILLHQVRTYAPYYFTWSGTGAAGYMNEYLAVIREHQPQARLGFVLSHSQWSNYPKNVEKSSYLRWQKTAESTRQFCADHDVDLVVPYGTAIENLRTTSLNNEYDLTRDGTHVCTGLGQYASACCYYEALIAPFTGVSILGNPYRYDASGATTPYPAISVTDDNATMAQWAAILAVQNPYECTNPEHYVTGIETSTEDPVQSTIYDLWGRRSTNHKKGIHIVVDAHGKRHKVLFGKP